MRRTGVSIGIVGIEEVLTRLAACINDYRRGGDARRCSVNELFPISLSWPIEEKPESLELKAVYAAAQTRWHRYHAAPDEESNDDLAGAVRFFGPILATQPDLVPAQLHAVLTSGEPAERPGMGSPYLGPTGGGIAGQGSAQRRTETAR